MSEGSRLLEFSEFLTPVRRKALIEPELTYKMVTLPLYGRGARLRKLSKGSELGTAKFEVKTGDLMISKIDARKGSNSLLPAELDGAIVTGDFLSYSVDEGIVSSRYLDIIVRSTMFSDLCDTVSAGTTNRVRLDVSRFLSLNLLIPPLHAQRRIVDLIAGLDEATEAAEQSIIASSNLQAELMSGRFATEATSPVADFAELLVGYAFRSSDYAADGIRLLRGDNIVPGGLRWDDAKLISEEAALAQSERYSLRADDIVLAMDRPVISSGVKVGLLQADDLPALLVQRVARLRPSSWEHGRSIELCFGSREFRAYLESGQVGSHVPHINGKQIAEFRVPVSMFQPGGSELIAAANDAAVASADYADSLRAVRTELVAALLSGEHEIPSSYDEHLGVVE